MMALFSGALLVSLVIALLKVGQSSASLGGLEVELDLSRQEVERLRSRIVDVEVAADELQKAAIDRRTQLEATRGELARSEGLLETANVELGHRRIAMEDPWALPLVGAAELLPADRPVRVDVRVDLPGADSTVAGGVTFDETRVRTLADVVLQRRGLASGDGAAASGGITIRLLVTVSPWRTDMCDSSVVAEIRRPVANASGSAAVEVIVARAEKLGLIGGDPDVSASDQLLDEIDRVVGWAWSQLAAAASTPDESASGESE